jgi:signal transduction histidine kinase
VLRAGQLRDDAQEPAGGTISIDYAASLDDYMVLLEIADSGPPIPDNVIEALRSGRRSRR